VITESLLSLVFGLLDALASLFPSDWEVPAFLEVESAGNFAIWARNADGLLPLGTIVAVVLASVTLLFALRLWDFAAWVYHQFWGSS
jgi:hypothetical protein